MALILFLQSERVSVVLYLMSSAVWMTLSHCCLQLNVNVPKIHISAVIMRSTTVLQLQSKTKKKRKEIFVPGTIIFQVNSAEWWSPPPRHATFLMHNWHSNAKLSECTGINLSGDVSCGPHQPVTLSKTDWKHAYSQLLWKKTVKISHRIQAQLMCIVVTHTQMHAIFSPFFTV